MEEKIEKGSCPFCKGIAGVYSAHDYGGPYIGHMVGCQACGAATGYYQSAIEAINAWDEAGRQRETDC